jgi:3-oxoacyl-[acyl-carrier-protein] synthase II
VITGLGAVTPLGLGAPKFWEGLAAGRSGISRIELFDPSRFNSQIGGQVRNFDGSALLGAKNARKLDRCAQFAMVAAQQAWDDAGLSLTEEQKARTGVAVGSGIGGMLTFEAQHEVLVTRGPARVSPFLIPSIMPNMAAGHIGMQFGVGGPNMAIVTACATGADSLGNAFEAILLGRADIMLGGGVDAAITPLALAGFGSMKALSTRNAEPERASRPFDRNRDGFVIGEGAGVMVLEALEGAQARGARIYAEVVGYGSSADAYHMTAPDPEGKGVERAVRLALQAAGIQAEDIDYINAHATSTPIGDKAETNAIKKVLGAHAHKVAISSTKSMTGHTLGAAGALESLVCVLAIQHQMAPPTVNLETPDAECDLDYVPNQARPMPIRHAMNNAFGFGGHNAILIFRRWEN